MNNIIDYVKEFGNKTFAEVPFGEVDALVLSQLSYMNFDGFVDDFKKDHAIPIKEIYEKENKDDLLIGYWYKTENMKLFSNAANSIRFGNMKLSYYVRVTNEEENLQFSAITYLLGDKSIYIAYRGTDASLVGWKEDFMLSYSEPVHAQELAVDYLSKVAGRIAGNFIIGGHSKGGNLSVYAAMFAAKDIQSRIIGIYDLDGPGFRPEIIKEGNIGLIKHKIHKYIPKGSIVGIIFDDDIPYEVVECWSFGALQHNSHVWKSEGYAFVKANNMSFYKVHSDRTLNEWIYSMSRAELELVIDTIYDVLTAADAKDLFDLVYHPRSNVISAVNEIKNLDQKTKDVIIKLIKRFIEISGEQTIEGFREFSNSIKEEMKTWQEEASSFMNRLTKKKK